MFGFVFAFGALSLMGFLDPNWRAVTHRVSRSDLARYLAVVFFLISARSEFGLLAEVGTLSSLGFFTLPGALPILVYCCAGARCLFSGFNFFGTLEHLVLRR